MKLLLSNAFYNSLITHSAFSEQPAVWWFGQGYTEALLLLHSCIIRLQLMDCVEQIDTQTCKIIETKRKYIYGIIWTIYKKVSKVLMINILKCCSLKED